MYVEAFDFADGGAGAEELGDDGHFLVGVDGHSGAVEVGHAHAVALGFGISDLDIGIGGDVAYVEIASVLVADTAIAVVAITALITRALGDAVVLAGMGSVGSGDRVGLPDIHLRAAGAVFAGSGVLVVVGWVPALDVGLTVDELDVVGALGIAVSWV